jgi:hypothetical protein
MKVDSIDIYNHQGHVRNEKRTAEVRDEGEMQGQSRAASRAARVVRLVTPIHGYHPAGAYPWENHPSSIR